MTRPGGASPQTRLFAFNMSEEVKAPTTTLKGHAYGIVFTTRVASPDANVSIPPEFIRFAKIGCQYGVELTPTIARGRVKPTNKGLPYAFSWIDKSPAGLFGVKGKVAWHYAQKEVAIAPLNCCTEL